MEHVIHEERTLSLFEKYLTGWVGVLIEVPVMLMLVKVCLRTRQWFQN